MKRYKNLAYKLEEEEFKNAPGNQNERGRTVTILGYQAEYLDSLLGLGKVFVRPTFISIVSLDAINGCLYVCVTMSIPVFVLRMWTMKLTPNQFKKVLPETKHENNRWTTEVVSAPDYDS